MRRIISRIVISILLISGMLLSALGLVDRPIQGVGMGRLLVERVFARLLDQAVSCAGRSHDRSVDCAGAGQRATVGLPAHAQHVMRVALE